MRIAILGAGCAGTCAALELSNRGLLVDLYDECSQPVSRASFYNEGKIHLGLLYAKDTSLKTARTMIEGATEFASLLDRWIGFDADEFSVSTPFFYAVHVGSMLTVDALTAHYERCKAIFDEMHEKRGATYLGMDRTIRTSQLTRSEIDEMVSGEYFVAMFRTSERAVDPRKIALRLRATALSNPRIRFIGGARVTDVRRLDDGQLAVAFQKEGEHYVESYDEVANTMWHGRLEIDARIGLVPERPWSHRYKFGTRVRVPLDTSIPSITCVLGPFGDIVNFGTNGLFVSWYPEGMIGTSFELRPPEWDQELTRERRLKVFSRSYEQWLARCPILRSVNFEENDVDPGGGVIVAWGDTPLQDPDSKLHDRYEVGVYSVNNYHTVNTGKFTLAPLMGLRTADRIQGLG
jgi:hypothetical protein